MTAPERSAITVRLGTIDDAAGTAALLAPIVDAGIYSAMEPPVTEQTQREFIEWLPDPSLLLVAEEHQGDGTRRIVGMQDLLPLGAIARSFRHVASISTFVALDRHRRGIAAQLFAETYRRAPELGFDKIMAFVRADNDAGRRAYFAQGFRVARTCHQHAASDPSSAPRLPRRRGSTTRPGVRSPLRHEIRGTLIGRNVLRRLVATRRGPVACMGNGTRPEALARW